MAKDKPVKIASKKHLARLERERRQTRLITSIAIAVVVLIVGAIGYGILNETVLKAHIPVVKVNGDSVTMHEFQSRVRVTRQQYVDQYMQYYQFAQMFGVDTSSSSSVGQTLSSIQTNLDTPTNIGQQVIDDITSDLLIRQYAKANGITVTEAEIDKDIQDAFSYFPDGTPTPTATSAPITYPTWSATQKALISPTPSATLAPTATQDLTVVPVPTITPDLSATPTLIPSLTPTSTPYTLSGFQGRYKDALAYYAKLGLTEAEFRKIFFESPLYRKKVSAIVTADVTHQQEQVWARHILVADEVTAKSIYDQLVAGADFATLASQNSLDTGSKDQGGDLGWFGKGKMLAEFEAAAFALKIGEISQPVQTTYGWHIIQVLGHEVRPLTDSEYTTAISDALTAWLTTQRTGAKIVTDSVWQANIPTSPNLTDAFNAQYETATAYANQALQQPTPTP